MVEKCKKYVSILNITNMIHKANTSHMRLFIMCCSCCVVCFVVSRLEPEMSLEKALKHGGVPSLTYTWP